MTQKEIILTGDRPTGPLHLGHFVGSLRSRVQLQYDHEQYVMIADVQALTDNFETPQKVRNNVIEVALDYLAVGIDPQKTTIFIQSMIPQIAELTMFFLNLVTINRLKRNPTVKTEIAQKNMGHEITAGFLMYPVSQTADITVVRASLVPVGEDQAPMIEQANEISHSFNRIYKTEIFPKIHALISKDTGRLPGIDGKAKMSKSLGNAIYLSDSEDTVHQKVMKMYTDPNHLHVSDPGNVEGNTVFAYLDIFDPNKEEVASLKEHYRRGGLGDVVIKKRLSEILNTLLTPIRTKREEYKKNTDFVHQALMTGTEKTKLRAEETMKLVRSVMHLDYTAR